MLLDHVWNRVSFTTTCFIFTSHPVLHLYGLKYIGPKVTSVLSRRLTNDTIRYEFKTTRIKEKDTTLIMDLVYDSRRSTKGSWKDSPWTSVRYPSDDRRTQWTDSNKRQPTSYEPDTCTPYRTYTSTITGTRWESVTLTLNDPFVRSKERRVPLLTFHTRCVRQFTKIFLPSGLISVTG